MGWAVRWPKCKCQCAAGSRDCVDEVDAMVRDVGDTNLDVEDVTVTGDTARAQVSQAGQTATFELARGDGGWQITSLGAQAG